MSSVLFLTLAMFAAPQVPVLSPGVHSLTLQGADGPPIHLGNIDSTRIFTSARVPLCWRCILREIRQMQEERCWKFLWDRRSPTLETSGGIVDLVLRVTMRKLC